MEMLDFAHKLIMVPWWVAERQMRMVDEIDSRMATFAQAIGCPHDRFGNLVPQNEFQLKQLQEFNRQMKRAYSDA